MYLLIDGGATSTKIYKVDKNKKILETKKYNFLNIQSHEEHSLEVIKTISNECIDESINWILIGMPGIHQYKNINSILDILNQKRKIEIQILTDIEVQDFLLVNENNHYIMSLGSGTVILENKNNLKKFINSFGPFFGDEGSAFDFAKEFIKKAIIDYDSENLNSNYIKVVIQLYKFNSIEDIKDFYGDWTRIRKNILNFSNIFFTSYYDLYKKEAKQIFEIISQNLIVKIKKIKIDKNIKFYITGGMSKNSEYSKILKMKLKEIKLNVIFL